METITDKRKLNGGNKKEVFKHANLQSNDDFIYINQVVCSLTKNKFKFRVKAIKVNYNSYEFTNIKKDIKVNLSDIDKIFIKVYEFPIIVLESYCFRKRAVNFNGINEIKELMILKSSKLLNRLRSDVEKEIAKIYEKQKIIDQMYNNFKNIELRYTI